MEMYLHLLKRKKVSFLPNIVVSKANIDYVDMTANFLVTRYGLKKISITRVGKPVNSTSWFDQFLLNQEDLDRLLQMSVEIAKKYEPCPVCCINP